MKPRVFLICISITLGIMSVKKTNIVTRIEEGLFNIRKLFQQNIMDYVCNKAGKSFLKKYQNGYDEKVIQAKKPNKYQQAIIDFAKDSKYKYIKKYFGRIAIFFVFLILDIIFVVAVGALKKLLQIQIFAELYGFLLPLVVIF